MEMSSFLKLSRTEAQFFRMIMLCETYSLITARLPMCGIKTKLETDDGKHQKKNPQNKHQNKTEKNLCQKNNKNIKRQSLKQYHVQYFLFSNIPRRSKVDKIQLLKCVIDTANNFYSSKKTFKEIKKYNQMARGMYKAKIIFMAAYVDWLDY